MKTSSALTRRKFLQAGLLVSAAVGSSVCARAFAGATKPERDPFDGLKLGIASYTFRKFSLDQAIAMTVQTGLKYINLKDTHLPLTSTAAECAATAAKIKEAGLVLMGGGVIYLKKDNHQVRGVFEYARNAGMPMIVCSPEPEALDLVESMAKEFDIRVAIHNHGTTDKKYPSPLDVMKLVTSRDSRIGICMDVGHTVRLGEDPVQVISQCAERLYDFHVKDISEPSAKGKDTEVGKGIIDIVGVFKTLVAIKFPGHIGLEYEAHADAPLPGVMESVAYMRGVLAAI
jgi:inosose dehydratase